MALDSSTIETERAATGIDRLWGSAIGHDTSFLLARANALSMARTHGVLAAFDLKVRSYALLGIVVSGSRPSQRELSEFLKLDPSQIVSLVDELQRKELVRREPDPRDRRANVVVPTPDGVRIFEDARQAALRSEAEWLADLPDATRDHFIGALARLAAS